MMKRIYFLIVLSIPMWALEAFAQIAASPSPSAVPLQGANNLVTNIGNHIPGSLPAWIVGAVLVVAEFIARRYPTVKPMSFFIALSQLFKGISTLFLKISGLLDQLIGQNVKSDGN